MSGARRTGTLLTLAAGAAVAAVVGGPALLTPAPTPPTTSPSGPLIV